MSFLGVPGDWDEDLPDDWVVHSGPVGVRELLAQIAELAQKGLEQYSEADRMERFLAETSRNINRLNARVDSCEMRVDDFIRRAQQAVTDRVESKPKPKKKVARSKRNV